MKEFISDNDIKMVVGKLFNWKIEPIYRNRPKPFGYGMCVGSLCETYSALYLPDEKELSLSNMAYSCDEVFIFYCEDIYAAEIIMDAFIKGIKFEIKGTIYEKQ